LVERLVELAEQTDVTESPSLEAAGGANGTLQRCLEELQSLKVALKLNDDGSLRQSKSVALLWPLKQKEFDARLQAIARIKSILQLALAADTTLVNPLGTWRGARSIRTLVVMKAPGNLDTSCTSL
jgi:hypothetical protein